MKNPLWIRFLLSAIATLLLIILLNTKMGQLPPLGRFLDPFAGVWQNALIPDIPQQEQVSIQGLEGEVNIVFDARGVPHIFAQNHHDLYFATGYVMAMHRLWQMDFGTIASMGRISEIIGEKAIDYDKEMRRLGMVYGAEKMLEAVSEDAGTIMSLNAFSNGVNAYLARLPLRKYPLEYKLLDYKPEPWTPLKTLILGMSINRTLSTGNRSRSMSYLAAQWGADIITRLYTHLPEDFEPIISRDKIWNIDYPLPEAPADVFIPQYVHKNLHEVNMEGIGSNNWAVSPQRSLSGNALFATDPHLGLTLPSIWYEMHLNAPGINVYGVTFPGVPTVIMGFNESISWGNTNTGNKSLDIYEIELDEDRLNYLHDGKWLPLSYRQEAYKIRGRKNLSDSIAFTHHGPVWIINDEKAPADRAPVIYAISWSAHETGNVIKPLQKISHAANFSQFKNALSELYAPPQNYAFASVHGEIAMQLNGLWPVRWKHQGMLVGDGRDSRYNWRGYLPFEYLPFELNPERGFISSANQHPVSANYPFFHGWHFASPARAGIINRTLSEYNLTPRDMMNLQQNQQNYWAAKYLHQMIDWVKTAEQYDPQYDTIVQLLQSWNLLNQAHSPEATIFEKWRTETSAALWKPLIEPLKDFRPMRPSMDITFRVLFHQDPIEIYQKLFGSKPNTAELLFASLKLTIEQLETNHGPMGDNWQWWRINGTTINHLLNIPALNLPRIQNGGSSESPNAVSGNWGPSWRMVAELSDPIRAWGIYPGGQTGNPASKGYKAFVDDWAQGNYYPLRLYGSFEEAAAENKSFLKLTPR
jgi:penicillin G amidase